MHRLEALAAAQGVSIRTVRDKVTRGEIGVVRVGARGVRVPDDEFRRLTGQPPCEDEKSPEPRAPRASFRGGAR